MQWVHLGCEGSPMELQVAGYPGVRQSGSWQCSPLTVKDTWLHVHHPPWEARRPARRALVDFGGRIYCAGICVRSILTNTYSFQGRVEGRARESAHLRPAEV